MKRFLNFFLFITFLFGYLEWGNNQHLFIFQAESEIIDKAIHDFSSVVHPLILIPFAGQIMILWTIFQKNVSRLLSLLGLAFLSIFMILLFVVGLLSLNIKVAGSTLPFIIAGIYVLKYNRKKITKSL